MNRIFILFGLVTTVMLVACSAKREENRALVASSVFSSFVDAYFDAYFSTYPSKGTAAGFHQYDDITRGHEFCRYRTAHHCIEGITTASVRSPFALHEQRGHD
jgi:hypothetical protein